MEIFVKQLKYGEDRGTKERRIRRTNGWSRPFHPLQIVSWIVVLYLTLYFYCTSIPSLVKRLQFFNYAIISAIAVVHLIYHVYVCSVDPADENVALKFKSTAAKPSIFNRNAHQNVIENFWCNICEVEVSAGSKHCGACNKCIAKFDHHCKWLNNCIGSRNYKSFICILVSAILACIWMMAFSSLEFISYFTDHENGNYLTPYLVSTEELWRNSSVSQSYKTSHPFNQTEINKHDSLLDFKVFFVKVPNIVWLVLTILHVVLCLVAALLLLHLFGFHLFLIHKGITTYDYIIMHRNKQKVPQQQPVSTVSSFVSLDVNKMLRNIKNNKITPVNDALYTKSGVMWIDFNSFIISTNNLFLPKVKKITNKS